MNSEAQTIIQRTDIGSMSLLEVRILAGLAAQPNHAADSAELRTVLAVVPATFSRVIDGLVQEGMITRADATGDRRRHTLTATGEALRTVRRFAQALSDATTPPQPLTKG